jgi:hypothetical protein
MLDLFADAALARASTGVKRGARPEGHEAKK